MEVDTETGDTRYLRHIAVDDCGNILNRRLVDGQALLEQVLYDEDANPLTTYLLPAAGNLPSIEIDHTITPTTQNALGIKGIGEAGTIGATAAIQNAVLDALRPLGVTHLDMPLTPTESGRPSRTPPGSHPRTPPPRRARRLWKVTRST